MEVWKIVLGICLWHIAGFVVWLMLGGWFNVQVIKYSFGIEFVNPLVIYKQTRVNWFGAILLAMTYGVMCPVATFIYWLYKLCTVGRK
jgi:hypothetical protein